MGWKNLRDHYGITHFFDVGPKGICIGSAYISNLIVIRDGEIAEVSPVLSSTSSLYRILERMRAEPEKLKELAFSEDTFSVNLPVYSVEDGRIVCDFCEKQGWPNTTHRGKLMYENVFFKTQAEALAAGKKYAEGDVKSWVHALETAQARVLEVSAGLEKARANQRALDDLDVRAAT